MKQGTPPLARSYTEAIRAVHKSFKCGSDLFMGYVANWLEQGYTYRKRKSLRVTEDHKQHSTFIPGLFHRVQESAAPAISVRRGEVVKLQVLPPQISTLEENEQWEAP
ncbi:hypothetical protein Pmani_036400 [Petrolisthes manimaculis]|uniref:Uncharacterized protein n=1 Tax=Petrolisthes manimaculis TaxID=1843537 RepID=A0AAE1TPF2_9EUCA|nr:hypothetical protein Pmani_036400 [Petrolisthes manimaculis]